MRGRKAAGGIMITSSHNPAQWNGVKYKAWYGGSGKPSIIAEIESFLGNPSPRIGQPAADPANSTSCPTTSKPSRASPTSTSSPAPA